MPENTAIVPYSGAGNPIYDAQSALAKGIFEATKGVTCPLYRDFPGFMTGSNFGSPYAAATDSILNELCSPTGQLPDPPSARFNGGQCVCVLYNVDYNFENALGQTGVSGTTMVGPITSVRVESTGNTPDGQPTVGIVTRGGAAGCGGLRVATDLGGSAPGLKVLGVTVTRQDGQPDNCGDPQPTYPVTQPPDSALNLTVPIQISPNFNIAVPVTVFAPINILQPTLKIGDFNIDFNLGGLTISPDFNFPNPIAPPAGGNPPKPPSGSTPSDRDDRKSLDEILRYLKRLRECQECDLDYDFLQTGFVTGTDGAVTVPSGGIPVAVGLEIISRPTNGKSQPGRSQPDVDYGGWGWFDGNGFMGEREPVDSTFKVFYAPKKPSAQTFRFTMQTGYAARVSMTYKRKKSPLPPV